LNFFDAPGVARRGLADEGAAISFGRREVMRDVPKLGGEILVNVQNMHKGGVLSDEQEDHKSPAFSGRICALILKRTAGTSILILVTGADDAGSKPRWTRIDCPTTLPPLEG
jgi:hypothetical protein